MKRFIKLFVMSAVVTFCIHMSLYFGITLIWPAAATGLTVLGLIPVAVVLDNMLFSQLLKRKLI